jgi:hypothetical protein
MLLVDLFLAVRGTLWSYRTRIFLGTVEEHKIGRLEGKASWDMGIKWDDIIK